MQQFKDSTGRTWDIDLPIGEVSRIRNQSEARFNLWDPTKDDFANQLANEMPLFWELLWFVVEPQATAKNVSAEDFGRAMAAECLYDAQKKFFAEWHDFFRRLQRPDLAAVVEKLAQYRAKALELVRAKLQTGELDQIDQKVTAKMEATLNEQFGKLRESLDSTLDPTPGVSFGDSEPATSETVAP